MRLMAVVVAVVPIVVTCEDFCLIKCEIDSMDGRIDICIHVNQDFHSINFFLQNIQNQNQKHFFLH